MVDAYLETALPARDLLTAERMGKDVVAPCAGCHVRMRAASQHILKDPELQRQFPFKGEIDVISGMDMFHKPELLKLIKEKKSRPLEGLRVVPYYGCLAVRPVEVVEPENSENPTQMDDILTALGAEVLSWPYKTDCCGGSLALTKTEMVVKLSRKLIDMALTVGADVMVTMCPMCQANLDTRQADISKASGKVYHMPVMYLTELIGVAFNDPKTKSWFERHIVSPVPALAKRGLA
jgi:heterodisulfide reductase subunit B